MNEAVAAPVWGTIMGILLCVLLLVGLAVILIKLAIFVPHHVGAFLLVAFLVLLGLGFLYSAKEARQAPMPAIVAERQIIPPPPVAVQDNPDVIRQMNEAHPAAQPTIIRNIPAAEANEENVSNPGQSKASDSFEKPKKGWLVTPNDEHNSASLPGSMKPDVVDRPAWCDKLGTSYEGNNTVVVVAAGPYVTPQECQDVINREMRKAVDRQLDDPIFLGPGGSNYVLARAPYLIPNKICEGVFTEVVNSPTVGEMRMSYARLVFKPETNQAIQRIFENQKYDVRFNHLVFGGLGLLGALGVVFASLKYDTATRGFYSGRLKLGAAAAIALIAGGTVFLIRS